MIIDDAIARHKQDSPFLHPKVLQRIKAALPRAKRMVFDKDSSRLLGTFVGQCVDLILKHRQFAMPPYDTMYIELDSKAMYEAIGGTASGPIKLDSPEADTGVGFLFDYRTVYTVATGPIANTIMPVFNYINPRGEYRAPNYGKEFPAYDFLVPPGEEIHFQHPETGEDVVYPVNDIAKLSLILGSSSLHNDLDTKQALALTAEVQYYYGGSPRVDKISIEGHQRMLTEIVGDVRNIYGVLLWLNSLPHTIKYTNMPAGHRIMKGKRVAMSAHNIVHIHLKGTVQIRNLFTRAVKEREHPRRHDVRGFWRHRHGIPQGCGHEWPDTPNRDKIYVCKKCGRERWWVQAHERGDASKGWVDKHYEVEI